MQVRELDQRLRERVAPVAENPLMCEAECELVMAVLMGMTPAEVKASPERAVPPEIVERAEGLLKDRVARRTPMQYLLSEARFHGLRLRVGPAVLIPRKETEGVVDAVLDVCRERLKQRPGLRVMDLGTGSGCIGLTVAWNLKRMPGAAPVRLIASDLSERALAVARDNATSLDLLDTVELRLGDGFSVVKGERFDVIACAPPYLDPGESVILPPEVKDNEPAEAIYSYIGKYGFYNLLATQGRDHLEPGGSIVMEVGDNMTPQITEIFHKAGFPNVRSFKDRSGMDRVVAARLGP